MKPPGAQDVTAVEGADNPVLSPGEEYAAYDDGTRIWLYRPPDLTYADVQVNRQIELKRGPDRALEVHVASDPEFHWKG